MKIDIESLGFTREELRDRIVDNAVAALLSGVVHDEDGNEIDRPSRFDSEVRDLIKERVAATIAAMGEKHVLPNVSHYIENFCIQETTKWGEPKGKKLTFTEFLVERAEAYLAEPVNSDGKAKAEGDYNWSGRTSRLSHLINAHLKYNIETALKAALDNLNKSVAGGLEQAVRGALNQVVQQTKIIAKVG